NGPAQTVEGQSVWSTDWTDFDGTHHTDPIDINCHCFDPTKTRVLNPAAWANVPNGQWAAQTGVVRYFRGFRFPAENINISRNFRIKERVTFQIRAEWQNAFNRLRLPQPSTTGFSANPTQSNGIYTGGFGTAQGLVSTLGSSSVASISSVFASSRRYRSTVCSASEWNDTRPSAEIQLVSVKLVLSTTRVSPSQRPTASPRFDGGTSSRCF